MSDDLIITPILGGAEAGAASRSPRARAAHRARALIAARRRLNLRGMRLAARGILTLLGQVDGLEPVVDAAYVMRLAARGGPMGLVTLGILAATAITARLESGRSFENMIENLKESWLGDTDNQVNASRAARQRLQSDENLMRVVGLTGSDNPQVRAIFDSFYAREKRFEDARQEVMRDKHMQVNGPWDIAIVGGTKRLGELLYSKKAQQTMRDFGADVHDYINARPR